MKKAEASSAQAPPAPVVAAMASRLSFGWGRRFVAAPGAAFSQGPAAFEKLMLRTGLGLRRKSAGLWR